MSRRCAWLAALATLLCLLAPASAGAYLYWNNGGCCLSTPSPGTIARATNDGQTVIPVFINPPNNSKNLQALAVGPNDIFWVDAAAGYVGHSGIDGSSPNNTFIQDAYATSAVAADSQYVFFTNWNNGTMYRANPNGTGKTLFISSVGQVAGMTDILGKLYWANNGNRTIYTSPNTSASPTALVTVATPSGGDTPNLQYVAVGNGYIYWSDAANNTIGRASLADPTGTVNDRFITGACGPEGVAVDANYVYWSNSGQNGCTANNNAIGRAKADGTLPNQRFITTGAQVPYGLQVDNGGVTDTTPPSETAQLSSGPAASGWYNLTSADPTVSWLVSDPDSIVSSTSGCDPTTVSTDTSGTSFTCTATSAGGASSATSTTIMRDKTAPTLTVPSSNVVTTATGSSGATVNFASQVTSSDATSGIASTNCSPASGSTFPIAITTVNCTATDNAGNTTTKSFKVQVNPNAGYTTEGHVVFTQSGSTCDAFFVLNADGTTDEYRNCPALDGGPLHLHFVPGGSYTQNDSNYGYPGAQTSFFPYVLDGHSYTATTSSWSTSERAYSAATYDQMIKAAGPIAYWPLDEAAGTTNTAFDVTGNGHDASVTGSPLLGRSPAQGTGNFVGTGSSWQFDGSTNYVTALNSTTFDTTPISFEAWVKPTLVGAYYTIMSNEGSDGVHNGYGFRQRVDGSFWFVLGGAGYGVGTASSPANTAKAGQWTYLVGTYDGSTLKLYVNGLLSGTAPAVAPVNSPNPLAIGRFPTGGENYPGTVDNAAVYNRVLSATAVAQHYGDTTPPVTTDNAPTGYRGAPVTVALTATDASGVATTQYRVDGGSLQTGNAVLIPAPADHSGDGVHTITYSSIDVFGNQETTKSASVAIDTTAPSVTSQVSSNPAATGWYNLSSTNPTISWIYSDPQSGVSSSSGCGTTTVTADTTGVSYTCSATSVGGTTAATSPTIKRDTVAPVLTVPTANVVATATSSSGAVANYTVSASDATSGVAGTPSCDKASGTTFPIGRTTVTCTTTDIAGNSTTKSFDVVVRDQNADPTLIGDWTFSNSTNGGELTGNWGGFEMKGDATISSGQLVVDGTGNGGNAATAWARGLNYNGPNVTDKTMVAWVQLDSNSITSGAPVSMYKPSGDQFDAVDYAERQAFRWTPGSNNFVRTDDFNPGVDDKNVGSGSLREIAISYKNVGSGNLTITACLNGVQIGQYTTTNGSAIGFAQSDAPVALFGPRHMAGGTDGSPVGSIKAHIDEARIYSRVIPCTQALAAKDSSTVVPNTTTAPGTLEAEGFVNSGTVSAGSSVTTQSGSALPWSGGSQLLFNASRPGSTMTAPFSVTTGGTFEFVPAITKSFNTGIYTISIDGQQVGGAIDTYTNPAVLSNVDLGPVTLAAGPHTITITVTGKNPSSIGYIAAIDDFQLKSDSTPPSVTSSVSPGANAAGWYSSLTGNPTVSWLVTDPETLVTSQTGCSPTIVTADTAGTSYTCSATSLGGTTSLTSATIKRDATPPVLTVPTAPVVVTATGPAGATANYTVSSSDNLSGTQPISCSQASGSTFPLGDTTVSCSTSDVAGNTTHASFTVRVQDGIAPVTTDDAPTTWSNKDVVVHLSATDVGSGVASTQYRIDNGDVQRGAVVTIPAPADNSADGTHTITYRSIDNAGNAETSHDATVKIDTTSPAVTTGHHADGTNGWNISEPVAITTSADDGAGSGAGPVSCDDNGTDVTSDGVTGSGSHDVTCSSTDAAGNTGSAVEHVKIDTTAPVLQIPSGAIQGLVGSRTAAIDYFHGATDDQTASPSVDCSPAPGTELPIGDTTVTCTATDDAGNTATGSFVMHVTDNSPPTVSHVITGNYVADAGWYTGDVSISWLVDDPESDLTTSGCDATTLVTDTTGQTFGCSATSAGGTTTDDPFSVRIDNTPPTVTVAHTANGDNGWDRSKPTVTATADDGTGSGVAADPSCVDSADGKVVDGTWAPADGAHLVTCTGFDRVGFEAIGGANVLVDETAPTITVTHTANGDNGWNTAPTVDYASPAADATSGVFADPSCFDGDTAANGSVSDDGVHTVTCYVRDAAGNTSSASDTIKIDTRAPVLTPSHAVDGNNGWNVHAPVQPTATATDNGSGVTDVGASCDSAIGEGEHDVLCRAADSAGNVGTITDHVKIDTVAPATTDDAPAAGTWSNHDVTVTADASDATSGVASTYMKVDDGDYAKADSVTVPASAGDGPHSVSYYSVDNAGNTETAHAVTVNIDTTAPTTTDDAPADWVKDTTTVRLNGADAKSGVASTDYRVDGGDVRDGNVVTIPAPADHSNDGLHTIRYRSIDKAGNAESAHDVTVRIDTTAPAFGTVDVPATTEAKGPRGSDVAYHVPVSDGGGSGAGPVSCSTDRGDSHSGDTFPVGTTKVTCSSTDGVGLSSTVSFDVVVVDTTAPDLTVPAVAPTEATGASGAVVRFDAPTAVDIVDGSVAPDCSAHSGDTFAIGTATVTCKATDAHGNTSKKSFDVTVRDTTAPVVTAPADQVAEATGGAGARVTFGAATAKDIVDGSMSATCAPASGSTFAVGTTTVTCSATDAATNTGTATFKVTVTDKTPPVLTVPDVTYAEATGGNSTAVKIDAKATDLVDGTVAVTCTPASGSVFSIGVTPVTCTATDAHGNTSTKSGSVVVYRWATDSRGAFVISDKQAVQGASVTFWGAQWEKANPFSSGLTGSASFKGYIEPATGSAAPAIGGTWTSGNGTSTSPPAAVPSYMAVVVASKEAKSGSAISGDVKRIAIVKTNAGYANDAGHAGTGTVVGLIG